MNTDKQRYIVDYTMAHQYVVTVGSLWDYNRSLDNSRITSRLKVKAVHEGGRVEFEQKMPFTTYGIEYFDGYVFKPSKL